MKSKPERGLGSAPGRFRLATPCFARISQRHLITHRSCHVHKVVAQRRNSNLVLMPSSLPPSFLPPIRFGVFLRHWPRRRTTAVSFILLTCAIAPGCNCERATDRPKCAESFFAFHSVRRSVPSISPETIIAFYFGARSGRCEGSMCRNLT